MTTKKPNIEQTELKKLEKQFDDFNENVQSLTHDRLSAAPKEEQEPQTKLSQNQIADAPEIRLKPHKMIGSKEKFNEKYREDYNFAKEYVYFIAENKEIPGETIEMWTKPFAGCPAEFWVVPVNKPIYAPRYVAEQIKSRTYHRLTMDESVSTTSDGAGRYYGAVAVDKEVNRLDATPATRKRSVFVTNNF